MVSNGRGVLCESIINKSKKFLGTEITQKELRLYPYLDYVWKNSGHIDLRKLDNEEVSILNTRIIDAYMIMDSNNKIYPTKEFYYYVQDILADAYVEFMED